MPSRILAAVHEDPQLGTSTAAKVETWQGAHDSDSSSSGNNDDNNGSDNNNNNDDNNDNNNDDSDNDGNNGTNEPTVTPALSKSSSTTLPAIDSAAHKISEQSSQAQEHGNSSPMPPSPAETDHRREKNRQHRDISGQCGENAGNARDGGGQHLEDPWKLNDADVARGDQNGGAINEIRATPSRALAVWPEHAPLPTRTGQFNVEKAKQISEWINIFLDGKEYGPAGCMIMTLILVLI